MALIDALLDRLVKRGVLTLTDAAGKTRRFGAPDPAFPNVAIRFNDRRVPIDLVRKPKLGMAEAYMDGRVDITDGDVWDMIHLIAANNPWEAGKSIEQRSRLQRAVKELGRHFDRLNDRTRARRNVAHHYDLSDRLYDLFLDRDKQYSCAYFLDPAETLEQAQENKKAHIAAKLALRPGMKVLDIGCGWGGMALYLHRHFGVDVLGVTLSQEQLKVAKERARAEGVENHVRFELIDYRDVLGPFDRIVSVGMFEHVGLAHYPEFFQHCRRLLTDDGMMLLHTIGRMGGPHAMDAFTRKYTFPGAYVPALSEMMAASEGTRLFVTDVEILRIHYGLTLRHWYDRTVAAKDRIVALYDDRFFRMWTVYLAGAAAGFNHGGTVNYQIQYGRDRRTLPLTRDYMVEAEDKLLKS
jgi:cyclopropane-fatty-acyl-phospholipid synthase